MQTLRLYLLRLTLICISACMLPAAAQAKKQRHTYTPPKAILVQLFTETNRTAYLVKNGREQSLAQLQLDIKEVTSRIVMDFSDNFYYCPVYFFIDTNAKKIAAGQFDGILLDKDLQPAKDIVLHAGDTGFFIGYFGPRASDFTSPDDAEYFKHHNDMDTHVPAWVVLDHNFHTLRAPLPHAINVRKAPAGYKLKQPASAYVYTSPKFNIAYAPSALLYSATLEEFYRRHQKRNK